MGYDAHLAKAPFPGSKQNAFVNAMDRYQRYVSLARNYIPPIITESNQSEWLLNGGGSLTFQLYQSSTIVNDVTIGSALLKPGDFIQESLSKLLTAAYIAAPVLKVLVGTKIPYIKFISWLWSNLVPLRQMSYFIYGGYWKAKPISPLGLCYNPIYGRSSNQELINGSCEADLKQDDVIFLIPDQSEEILRQFGDLFVVRAETYQGRWAVLKF